MKTGPIRHVLAALALVGALGAPATAARADTLELDFDQALGSTPRTPKALVPPAATVRPFDPALVERARGYGLDAQIAALAGPEQGRIGVAAVDLASGRTLSVLGDVPFPMASTSKVAIVATFLEGVDQGRFSLDQQFPLMVPVPSARFSGSAAPVRPGARISARGLIDLTISRSDNQATDALLKAVGGPDAVNRWLRQTGNTGLRLDRDIATLVRDDGEYNPATTVDLRDSATPLAMVQLLTGLYQGRWLSPASRDVLMGAMERTVTGKRRIRAQLPGDATVLHKTGTLSNTASDVGIIRSPDGRTIAVAIYVTGQGGKVNRDARIATIARVIYDGYQTDASSFRRTASR